MVILFEFLGFQGFGIRDGGLGGHCECVGERLEDMYPTLSCRM